MAADQTAASSNDSSRPDDRGSSTPPVSERAVLAGNLTADPELRYTNSGRPCGAIRVAVVNRVQNTDTGQWSDTPARFYNVKIWGLLGERAVNCLQKGDRVVIKGHWTLETWTNSKGEPQQAAVVVAEDIGASLQWTEVRIPRHKGERSAGQHRAGRKVDATPAAPAAGETAR